ncbi:MAG: hypothetical protein ACYS8Z_26185 [Planctomycetota bacterium]|jgi:hypothetical protein
MKTRTSIVVLLLFACISFAQDKIQGEKAKEISTGSDGPIEQVSENPLDQVELPAKNSVEYINVRDVALTELIPFFTKLRAEMRTKRKLLANYLVKINKASDYAKQTIKLPVDPRIEVELLSLPDEPREEDVEMLSKNPSWDDFVEIAMRHVIYEGYIPTALEEGTDIELYKEISWKKEVYCKKVQEDLGSILDQSVKIWVYLDSIDEQGNFIAYMVELELAEQAKREQRRAAMSKMKRDAALGASRSKKRTEICRRDA